VTGDSDVTRPERPASFTERVKRAWRSAQGRWPWLAHVVRAWGRFTENNGNQYAGAITFFSFLALFPLILLAVSITGFVLNANLDLQRKLLDKVAENVPGGFGDTLRTAIDSAIANRTAVGVVGLVGVLLSGLGWIANLRMAINSVWGFRPVKRKFVTAKIADLIVLLGLGLGGVISIGFTAVATSVTGEVLRALGLDGVPGAATFTTVLGFAIAIVGDMIILGWILVRLPKASVPRRVALRGTVLAAVGFEVLKVLGTYTIAATSHSVTAGPFAAIVAVLVWMQLVARWVLFCAAWMATWITPPGEVDVQAVTVVPVAAEPEREPMPVAFSPVAVAASLIATGAAVGGGLVAWLTGRRRRAANVSRSGTD
jgi:membrane protein